MRFRIRWCACVALLLLCGGRDVSAGVVEDDLDWPALIGEHDMAWSRLPQSWNEAPHFGNAMLGSMLYQSGNSIRLQVFRADVYDHRGDDYGWPAYSRPRLRVGSFYLHPVGKLTGCEWSKDLWNAELTGIIRTDRGEIRIRHYVHADDMVILTELLPSEGEEGVRWEWRPQKAETTRPGYPRGEKEIAKFAKRYGQHYAKTLKVHVPNPAGRKIADGEVTVWVQDLLADAQYATAWTECVAKSGARVHLATVANSHPGRTAQAEAVATIRSVAVDDEWVARHRAWWHAYYPRSYVSVPNKSLESLYWQTIYRYGCTSRKGRAFVDTPGIWFQGGGWAYTTTDWNIQAAHWFAGAANRLDQGAELLARLHKHRDALIKAVRPLEWQADSAYLPIEVSHQLKGSRDQDMRYWWLVGDLPWAMNNCWMLYRHSMDDVMLRERIFPLLRRSVNLYLHMLSEGADGKLHLPPTYSPETGVVADCNFDLALLKWGCHTLLNACQRLGVDDPLIPRWEEVIRRSVDFPVDANGYMLGKDKTSSGSHRHASHLLMIYPLYLANIEQGGDTAVLKKSYGRFDGIKGLPAMVQAHAGPMGAALGLGDSVLAGLKRQQGNLHPNGMWYSPPCLESSLTMANTVQEMLLQSWCDPADRKQQSVIRIFPALPSSWDDVAFHDLSAEGGFLVSACREGGATKWVRLRSLAGEPCVVRPGLAGEVKAHGARAFALEPLGNGDYEVDLRKGEELLLYVGGSVPAARVR